MPQNDVSGLTSQEVVLLRQEFGRNVLSEKKKSSIVRIFQNQLKNNFVVYLLVAAIIISFFVGKYITAIAIFGVISLVVGAGFFQEYKAEKAVEALKNLLTLKTRVRREGQEKLVESTELVPNDIVLLGAGDKVPADAIILSGEEVTVDESILTGEAQEVVKKPYSPDGKEDKSSMVFMGTFITSGNCVVKVTQTGMKTEFGKIAELVEETQKTLPLQSKVNRITKYMVVFAISVSVLTGVVYVLQSGNITLPLIESTLILVIALSVSAFPEGFPVVLTTTLAVGVMRMAKRNAIVNRMSVIESLGETTVIATDKTGTVTRGEMTVKKIILDNKTLHVTGIGYETNGELLHDGKKYSVENDEQLTLILLSSVLCNNASFVQDENEERKLTGSATDTALLALGEKAGFHKDNPSYIVVEEFPFTSERKMMSVETKRGDESFIFSKGAPEMLIKHCKHFLERDKVLPLTEEKIKELLGQNSELTTKALRTIAFAYKKNGGGAHDEEEDLTFLGIAALEDSPREEVVESIEMGKKAGIAVKLITGDHKETAQAVARQIGILDTVITGEELEKMTDEQLRKEVMGIGIFARVMPEQKLRIVRALKETGEIVAMTGDGVNDAPALEEAHVGIAMGKRGTDVARSASDLILKDDNFSTIMAAIIEGRTIFNNIRKFTTYQLSCNFAELMVLFIATMLAPFLSWSVPLLVAIQILFMNLVTDNLPAIMLGFNPSSKDIMHGKFKKNMDILDRKLIAIVFMTGILMGSFVLLSYYISFNVLGHDAGSSRTVALVALIVIEICAAFVFRSFRKGVLTRSPFSNKYLLFASIISLLATLTVIYTPLSYVFETVQISFYEWGFSLAFGFLLLIIFDVLKFINPKTNIFPAH